MVFLLAGDTGNLQAAVFLVFFKSKEMKASPIFQQIFCYGQKPAVYGQNGRNLKFVLSCQCNQTNRTTQIMRKYVFGISALSTAGNKAVWRRRFRRRYKLMRHFYLRMVMGIIWLLAAAVSLIMLNIPNVILYIALGIVFFRSAYSIRDKEKDKRK